MMRRTFSTSCLRYSRCPVADFFGASCGNSVSQNRKTYVSSPHNSATSPMRKYKRSGITMSATRGNFPERSVFDLTADFAVADMLAGSEVREERCYGCMSESSIAQKYTAPPSLIPTFGFAREFPRQMEKAFAERRPYRN